LLLLAKRFIETKKEVHFQNLNEKIKRLGYFANFQNNYSSFRLRIVEKKQVLAHITCPHHVEGGNRNLLISVATWPLRTLPPRHFTSFTPPLYFCHPATLLLPPCYPATCMLSFYRKLLCNSLSRERCYISPVKK
jgi:hypothetical protein